MANPDVKESPDESRTNPDKSKHKESDLEFLARMLDGVSRTFALTIPQLPQYLYSPVAIGYLLCRIVDTIEDEPTLSPDEKEHFSRLFCDILSKTESAEKFAEDLAPKLSSATLATERELISLTPRVVSITHSLPDAQFKALERCVHIMSSGMCRFQFSDTSEGLENMREMEYYCYYVAGVVGEMLTSLFADYSDQICSHQNSLQSLAISFGQGLQMTNILKDFWDDQTRSACWFPKDIFERHGCKLSEMGSPASRESFTKGLNELIGIALGHLRLALDYVILIPKHEKGIRRFCLWAIGMAVLSLKKLHASPDFASGAQVKISRRAVKAAIITMNAFSSNDSALKLLFHWASRGLPSQTATPPVIDAENLTTHL